MGLTKDVAAKKVAAKEAGRKTRRVRFETVKAEKMLKEHRSRATRPVQKKDEYMKPGCSTNSMIVDRVHREIKTSPGSTYVTAASYSISGDEEYDDGDNHDQEINQDQLETREICPGSDLSKAKVKI
ncbi:hypothetical protein JTE90_018930 [Oedothorax gibbosus]|uniref:Uncharacterized protein n=1 Tax=Oedothorax gibbosus TaxID=931172 RepID=A0AAV6VWF5_9ARAC|nr:hypothetical protein JTE90_018930 [Oedothorax gibbosus]